MTSGNYLIKAVFLLAVSATGLDVSSGPRKVSLEDCMDIAVKNNLALKGDRYSVEMAKTMQGTAFDVEQTSVTLSQDATGGGGPENGISVSQSFEFPTVYVARHKSLKAETEVRRNSLEYSKAEVSKEVASVYYAMLYSREVIRIRQEQDSVYRGFLSVATAKFENGEAGRLELINAERMFNMNRLDLKRAEDDYNALVMKLKGLLNIDYDIAPSDSVLEVMPSPVPESDICFEHTPAGRVYMSQVELSRRNLSLAKQGFMPGLTVGATAQVLIKGFNPYDISRERFKEGNFMGFEIGVTLPLFFGAQRAKAKAARIEVERSQAVLQQAQSDTRIEYQNWLNRYRTASDNLEYYMDGAISQMDDLERISRVSYELGDIGYVEYMQNLESAAEMRLRYASAVNEYNQAVIMLNFMRGIQ